MKSNAKPQRTYQSNCCMLLECRGCIQRYLWQNADQISHTVCVKFECLGMPMLLHTNVPPHHHQNHNRPYHAKPCRHTHTVMETSHTTHKCDHCSNRVKQNLQSQAQKLNLTYGLHWQKGHKPFKLEYVPAGQSVHPAAAVVPEHVTGTQPITWQGTTTELGTRSCH
jgi:hypothetical protein